MQNGSGRRAAERQHDIKDKSDPTTTQRAVTTGGKVPEHSDVAPYMGPLLVRAFPNLRQRKMLMERMKTTKHTATAAIVAHSSLLLVLYQGRPSAGNRAEGCQGRHMHTSHHITSQTQ